MAAVAGSKGRLSICADERATLQKDVVAGLLAGRFDAVQAASTLVNSACIREVGVDTNMICNLACRYCYLQDRKEAKGSVPLDVLERKLSEMIPRGTKLFAFIGKEPLADERAPSLLRKLAMLRNASGQTFRTGMVTNGTLMERWIDHLVDADLSYLDISVDGLGDFENRLRGEGIASRIHGGIEAVVRSPLRERFATASVLTHANIDSYARFVTEMFDRGVVTCFASPVLRFAMSNEVSDLAVGMERIWRLADEISTATQTAAADNQVIIDLPYKYTWSLLRSRSFSISELSEDQYEAIYWNIRGSNIYIKLNPFSYSFWRALRITHDGHVITNMDLAAHADYAEVSRPLQDAGGLGEIDHAFARDFLAGFITRHDRGDVGDLHERDLLTQFQMSRVNCAA